MHSEHFLLLSAGPGIFCRLRFAAISLASAIVEVRYQITLVSLILSSFLCKQFAFGGMLEFQALIICFLKKGIVSTSI